MRTRLESYISSYKRKNEQKKSTIDAKSSFLSLEAAIFGKIEVKCFCLSIEAANHEKCLLFTKINEKQNKKPKRAPFNLSSFTSMAREKKLKFNRSAYTQFTRSLI